MRSLQVVKDFDAGIQTRLVKLRLKLLFGSHDE